MSMTGTRLRVGVVVCVLLLCPILAVSDEKVGELNRTAARLTQEGKWQEAAEVCRSLVEMEPDNPQHWTALARAYREAGDHEKAIAAYEEALALNESSPLALAGMAITLEMVGDVDRAFEFLTRSAEQGIPKAMFEQYPGFAGLREHGQFETILEVAERAANPCLQEGPYDDFDFWIGSWDIHVGGQKGAENLITREMNGCIIRERYSSPYSQGESINYYDPETGKWKQNWVDSTGSVTRYTGGLKEEGVMYMEGANTLANGTHRLARVTWTRLPDGKVHHVIEHSTDAGKTWNVAFDGVYHKADGTGRPSGT